MEEQPMRTMQIYATICDDDYTRKIMEEVIFIHENKSSKKQATKCLALYKKLFSLFDCDPPEDDDVSGILDLKIIIQMAYNLIFGSVCSDENIDKFRGKLASALGGLKMLPAGKRCILGDHCNSVCFIKSHNTLEEVKSSLRCIVLKK